MIREAELKENGLYANTDTNKQTNNKQQTTNKHSPRANYTD
jgi:hypothetical protein